MPLEADVARAVEYIQNVSERGRRWLVALVGAPASGKSTLAEHLAAALPNGCVVPMDGFHLDDRILKARGLLERKGAPDTFDVDGLHHLLKRLHSDEEVIFPLFDRALEISRAGAGRVAPETKTIVVEGNYLLLDAPKWRDLADLWDCSIYLSVPEDVLRDRLTQRWAGYGYTPEDAIEKIEGNDLPNARLVAANLLRPDLVIETADVKD